MKSIVLGHGCGVLLAGWLAQTMASADGDVDAGIEAYEAGEFDEALRHFDAAVERRGERPELALDRGLALMAKGDADAARKAFERATEAEDSPIVASAHYELGNLEFDAENWDAAIEHYVAALKARPNHENAQWNLELALQNKQAAEEDKPEEDEPEEDKPEEDKPEEDDGEETDGEPPESEDPGGDSSDTGGEPPEQADTGGEQPESEDTGGQQESPDAPDEPQGSDDPSKPAPAAPEPQPIDQADMDRALEQLDEADGFTFDRPQGGYIEPEKDW